MDDDDDTKNNEYYYEGEFVDGYKHGIGRLHEPSGSYFYAYWEYNKPGTGYIYIYIYIYIISEKDNIL